MNIFHNFVVLEYSKLSFLFFWADQISSKFVHWYIFELFWNTYFNKFLIFLSIYIGILIGILLKVRKKGTSKFFVKSYYNQMEWLWAPNSSVGKAPDYKKFWDPGLNLCLVHHYFYHSFLVNFTQMLYVYVYPISYIRYM